MKKTKKIYKILSFEADNQAKLRPHSLFNLFQDVADISADSIGVGYDFCRDRGIGWVAFAYHVKINRMPVWKEEITIKTWPSGTTAVCGIRDFSVLDGQGNHLIMATSQWALIDVKSARPISVAKHLPHYEPLDEHALISDFPKIITPAGDPETLLFPVHHDDIDMNGHVNNALYPTWCLDCVDDNFRNTHHLSEIRVFFKRPAKFGMMIAVQTYTQGDDTIHILMDEAHQVEFARVQFTWTKA